MKEHISYEEARELLLRAVHPVETERLPLSLCGGRVLAETLTAAADIPPFDRSPYDGYALRAADTAGASPAHPAKLRVIEEIPAGAVPQKTVTAGTAARIMTGAPIPNGADAVVMFEKTVFSADAVQLSAPLTAGTNIVRVGEDVKKGQLLADCGCEIDTGLIGTLAAQGIAAPAVYRRPRVGLIMTGSEVVEVGAVRTEGKIYNTNRYTMETALRRANCEPVYRGIVGDCTDVIAACITRVLTDCDAVLLTGGVSAGDYDCTPAAMQQAGVSLTVRGIAMKPGMAGAYGLHGAKPVFGLSGNPGAALAALHTIVLPVLRKRAGYRAVLPREITVTLENAFPKRSPLTRLVFGRLMLTDGTVRMQLPQTQGNGILSSLIGCDAAAVVPVGSEPLAAGTILRGFLL